MNPVETILLQNIDNPNSIFIFPTDVAASQWADHLLRLRGGALAMNKFIAWDVFKQNSIKSKVQDKKSIPSALRKIFVCRLVRENADLVKQNNTPLFLSIIQTRWAGQAAQFTPWLTKLLPQLGTWYKKSTGLAINNILEQNSESSALKFEGDDKDIFLLARRYAQFLDKHGLFEPAWETPPFNDEGKTCFIFFPESLADYSEYKELLDTSGHVKTIGVSDTENLPCDAFFYTNSRREITEAALYIRALNEKQDVNWDSIVVCLPDAQSYEPYVVREFTNRNIPFTKRISKPLANYPAGRFFHSVYACVSQDFSFSSLVSLLMNKNLPWKNTEQINNLINFGIKNNCLYSWIEQNGEAEQKINVWEDAFKKPFGGIETDTIKYFEQLKRRLQVFCSAVSFSELRKQYFIFREQFLDMENCSEETDIVLSRCISELMYLIELEKDFPELSADIKAIDPFNFFTEYLEEIYYLAQQKTGGVAILPYKVAAAAPYDCHIILGADQDSLSLVNTHLDFLPKKKREQLGIFDEDASKAFINMHKYNSVKHSSFFCSEQTFSGFTIPHSNIGSPSEPLEHYPDMGNVFSSDFYNAESLFFSSLYSAENSTLIELHENQINGFISWKNRQISQVDSLRWSGNKKMQDYIRLKYARNGKYNVSASSLRPYFQCSLKWLFERVYTIENVQTETSLMSENISGLVYHTVLNHFLTEIKNKNEIFKQPDNTENGITLPSNYLKNLENSIETVFSSFPITKPDGNSQMSAITGRLLCAIKREFQYQLEIFLAQFISFFTGCQVTESEVHFESEKDTYILKGEIDCILKNPSEDKYTIVDFKLKSLPKRDDCTGNGENGLSNFQLPMYISLTEDNKNINIDTALFNSIIDLKSEVLIGAIQDTITKKIIPKKETERIFRGDEWYNKIFNEFNEKVLQFSAEISSGEFSIFETNHNNCYSCYYHRICRTTYIINRQNMGIHQ